MIDHLFWECEVKYRQAVRSLAAGENERALIAFHEGLEALLRWRLVHDGADLATAIDPARVGWPELLLFLDAPYGLPERERAFLAAMVARYQQAAEGQHPELPAALMGQYAEEIRHLFQRFYTRDPPQRTAETMRAAYGRPRPDAGATPPAPATPPAAVETPAAAAAPNPWAGGDLIVQPGAPSARTAPPTSPARPAAGARTVPPGGWSARELGGGPGTTYETTERRAARLADEQRQRALSAGQRLREVNRSAPRYCPGCREVVAATETACPHCGRDLTAYGAARPATAPHAATPPPRSMLERLFGRRSSPV